MNILVSNTKFSLSADRTQSEQNLQKREKQLGKSTFLNILLFAYRTIPLLTFYKIFNFGQIIVTFKELY